MRQEEPRPPNYTMNPPVSDRLNADFVRTLTHCGLGWR